MYKGEKTDPSNYCPITFIHTLTNMIERAIHVPSICFQNRICYKTINLDLEQIVQLICDLCLSYLTNILLKEFDAG